MIFPMWIGIGAVFPMQVAAVLFLFGEKLRLAESRFAIILAAESFLHCE